MGRTSTRKSSPGGASLLSLLYHLAYLQSYEFLTPQGPLRGGSAEVFSITCMMCSCFPFERSLVDQEGK